MEGVRKVWRRSREKEAWIFRRGSNELCRDVLI